MPETGTWAPMAGGFGLVGGTLRRRTAKPRFSRGRFEVGHAGRLASLSLSERKERRLEVAPITRASR